MPGTRTLRRGVHSPCLAVVGVQPRRDPSIQIDPLTINAVATKSLLRHHTTWSDVGIVVGKICR